MLRINSSPFPRLLPCPALPSPGSPLPSVEGKIKAAAEAQLERIRAVNGVNGAPIEQLPLAGPPRRIVAIGASTGGTQAIEKVLTRFPANGPATLIVQHMPAYFTASFAERLNKICAMDVREAADRDVPRPGLALIAPGNKHMLLRQRGEQLVVEIKDGPMVHHQRPSVEVFFQSIARCGSVKAAAALLTGMGSDGANGLLTLRQRGDYTLAQDQASSVVFGMPGEAIKLGAATEVAGLNRVAELLLQHACES